MKLIETNDYKIIAEHIKESITDGQANVPKLTDAGCKILQERYLQKDNSGKPIETYTELFIRVAATVAIAETCYGTIDDAKKYGLLFYNMMASMDFLPNSPIFKGAGLGINCAACYVLSIEDSRESIFRVLAQSVEIQAFGGGVGYNFSNLREKGARIKSTGGVSNGPVSFMKIFDLTIGQVITQGAVRQGAQMGILMYNHPDIIEFIESKKTGSLTNFNISVGITEEFMKLAQANEDFDIISPLTGKVGTYNAGKLLDFISQNAHETGDPGILFMDRIESFNPVPSLGPLSVNPCSESHLQNFENCTLGSINIANFVIGNEIDYDRLDGTIELAVRFLDNVIDINDYPIPEIEAAAKGNRKIGLGIMGWADALVKMGIKYDSIKGVTRGTHLMYKLNEKAEMTSMQLGREKGVFPNYDLSIYKDKYYPGIDVSLKRRNASLTMIAPTGCQSPNTLVMTNKGILRLGEIVDEHSKWSNISFSVNQETGSVLASRGYSNGICETVKIELESGLELECTPDHKFRTFNDQSDYVWIEASNIIIDTPLAVKIGGYENESNCEMIQLCDEDYKTSSKNITTPATMTEELAYLIGFYFADGSTHKKGMRLHFGKHNSILANNMCELVEKIFSIKPVMISNEKSIDVYVSSIPLLKFLIQNGCEKNKSWNVSIPMKIRASSPLVISSFIKGFSMGDGYYIGDRNSDGKLIDISTTSKQMAQDMLICLRAIGINSRIRKCVYSKDSGHLGKRPVYRIRQNVMRKESIMPMRPNSNDKQLLTMSIKLGLIIDRVVSISRSVSSTFDIEVPENNTYIANSIVSHNTLGTIADVNGGIEPFFLLAYKRGSLYKDGKPTVYIDVVNKYLNEYINNLTVDTVGIAPNSAITDKDFIIESIVKKLIEHGSIQDSNIFPELESVKDIYVTSHDIHYKWHLEMQRAFQKHCEMGISKTVNTAHNATIDDVKNIYIEAYKGCYIKGVTVYRDGCKEHQVLTKIDQHIKVEIKLPNSSKRPNKLPSFTHRLETPVGKLYTSIAFLDGKEYEVFLNIGKAGADITACAEGYGRLLSMLFKYGIPLHEIVDQLSGIGGSNSVGIGPNKVKSLPDGISQVLSEYVNGSNDSNNEVKMSGDICPSCGHMLVHEEACTKCKNCDYSKC